MECKLQQKLLDPRFNGGSSPTKSQIGVLELWRWGEVAAQMEFNLESFLPKKKKGGPIFLHSLKNISMFCVFTKTILD